MHSKTVAEWVDWQQRLHTSSIDLGLERIRVVARRMGLLSPPFKVITIAGTNGKGSSATLLEFMLRPHAKIGTYTSPHFLSYNERIRIDGIEVDDTLLCAAFEQVEQMRGNTSLSFFEYGTLAALWIFHECEIDYAILEVGLGGRMDAVNLWDTDLAMITSIGIDHTEWLGRTREAIGREKAGIMRPDRPVICGEPNPPLSLADQAERLGAPMQRIGIDYFANPIDAQHWQYHHRDGLTFDFPIPPHLPGKVQLHNAASALTAMHALDCFDPPSIRQALQEVHLTGRFQVLDMPIDTVLDIAHNPDSAVNLAKNLGRYRAGRTLHAVFSALKEKDIAQILIPLAPMFDSWHFSEVISPRTTSLEVLRLLADSCQLPNVHFYANLTEAYEGAAACADAEDSIIVFGSAFAIGEFLLHHPQSVRRQKLQA